MLYCTFPVFSTIIWLYKGIWVIEGIWIKNTQELSALILQLLTSHFQNKNFKRCFTIKFNWILWWEYLWCHWFYLLLSLFLWKVCSNKCWIAQLCPVLCDPMDCSLPGSSVHGILQASILECVAMPSSRGSSWPRDRTYISYVSCIGTWVPYH